MVGLPVCPPCVGVVSLQEPGGSAHPACSPRGSALVSGGWCALFTATVCQSGRCWGRGGGLLLCHWVDVCVLMAK